MKGLIKSDHERTGVLEGVLEKCPFTYIARSEFSQKKPNDTESTTKSCQEQVHVKSNVYSLIYIRASNFVLTYSYFRKPYYYNGFFFKVSQVCLLFATFILRLRNVKEKKKKLLKKKKL